MMSKMSEGRMNVHWSIDGATRNDYRENVSLDKVLGNVKSYTQRMVVVESGSSLSSTTIDLKSMKAKNSQRIRTWFRNKRKLEESC